jgi:hypothetical protein
VVLTLAAVAAHKKIRPERIDVRIDCDVKADRPLLTACDIQLDLGGGLTERERTILYNSARICEVHQLLAGEIDFKFRLVDGCPPDALP